METSMSEWSVMYENRVDTLIRDLNPAKVARYNSQLADAIGRRSCTENTRKETLTEIEVWCNNPNAPMIYWMNGMAGTGKTTIAYTVAKSLDSCGQLAASYFCTVTSEECRKAGSIIPTIAHQLSHQSTPFKAALGEVLRYHPDAPVLSVSEQLERLLIDPLNYARGNMAPNQIVVIDALDECHDSNVVGLILGSLISSAVRLPLRFLVTSRPERVIYDQLSQQTDELRAVLHLHEVGSDTVQRDIKLYLTEGLQRIQPSEDDLERLMVLSERLFIYAATAVRYIIPETASVNSRARLNTMLDINSKSTKKLFGIDTLYTTILSNAVDNDALEPYERDDVLSVVWAVVSSNRPVSAAELGVIAGLSDDTATLAALAPLRSVLHVSHTDDTISTFHASFLQYMFDKSRSNRFYCDLEAVRKKSALRCLRVINTELPSSIQSDTEVSTYLTTASREWVGYLVIVTFGDLEGLYSELRNFFEERFGSWFRLRLNPPTKKLPAPSDALTFLSQNRYTTRNNISDIIQWLRVVRGPADLLQAAENAKNYMSWSGADRKLVRDRVTRSHIDKPYGSTETPLYTSWIWEDIDIEAIRRQAFDELSLDTSDSAVDRYK